MGRDKTVERMRQKVHWYGMSTCVEVHMVKCDACSHIR